MLCFILHARLRVHLASGIPCALFTKGAEKFLQTSDAWRREIAEVRLSHLSSRESGGPSTPRPFGSIAGVSGILGRPHSRATTTRVRGCLKIELGTRFT